MRRLRKATLFSPLRWPVRWRLAAVSAGLTFVILLVFAVVVGRLAQDRLRDDFRTEIEGVAADLSSAVRFDCSSGECSLKGPSLELMAIPKDAGLRIVDGEGRTVDSTGLAPDLGLQSPGLTRAGPFEVAVRPISTNALGAPSYYVQYTRTHEELDATISRLWLFLGCGVVFGAMLATLAGLAVARRAMRPIAELTAAAREIASTRDPSLRLPQPASDDEVAELARTLDSMLRELDAARDETQQMVTAQREFVADASHELRTPLTSILANLELLHERLAAGGEEAEMVDSALRSSRRMRRLVADLLLLAQADAGRVSERGDCDLAEIAEAALAEVRPVADRHVLALHGDDKVPTRGNADELHRLVANLIDNAVRHTPPGTCIDVTVRRRDDAAVLEVCDDGPGLPAGSSEHLFSRFVRGTGPGDESAIPGAGLGLAIVRAVAASHGGKVEAGEAPHGGARFTVTLPTAHAPAQPTEINRKVSANL